MGIDDPIEAIERQYKDESNPAFQKIIELLGSFEPTTAIANSIHKVFSKDSALERINALIDQFIIEIRRLEGNTKELNEKLGSPEFAESVLVAINETARTTNIERIKRFAKVLGYSLADDSKIDWEDAQRFIRDISELGDKDIQALEILASVYDPSHPIVSDPEPYYSGIIFVSRKLEKANISKEVFYSRCMRLSGFGLVIEVQRNNEKMKPGDYCFRLTGTGNKLISMLAV